MTDPPGDTARDRTEELRTKRAAILQDPLNFTEFNPAQLRFFDLLRSPGEALTVVEFLKGNGLGGSFALVAAFSAIVWGTRNPLFKAAPFGPERWPFNRDLRLVTTTESLTDKGPIQTAMRLLFPAGRWLQSRGVGKSYYSQGMSDTGFTWDFLTYNQAVDEFASHTKGAVFFSEPPPEGIFFECATRLRGRGLILVDMTQLDMAGFNEELLDRGLVVDDKKVGEVRHTYGDHHESCNEHFKGGHRTHASIEADYALWLRQEPGVAEARKSGRSMLRSGRIYPHWSEANVLKTLPEYHQQCWDSGKVRVSHVLDPHDRKPWAMAWFATFPNQDAVVFAEWPNFEFAKCADSPITDIENYRDLIIRTEAEIGIPVTARRIDPNFGAAPKAGTGLSVMELLASACRRCRRDLGEEASRIKCRHRLDYRPAPDAVDDGHILVRAAIGNPAKGVRPKLFALSDFAQNFIIGHRGYSWKENRDATKGRSERPQIVLKDFPDLSRYFYLSRLDAFTKNEELPANLSVPYYKGKPANTNRR